MNENSKENNKEDNNSLATVTFHDDLEVILDITFALALSFKAILHLKILKKSNFFFIEFFDYICYFELKKL